ncbi:hypothetical protein G379_gp064 [Dickeya phage vB-DsoM-LIMEstone1]|mgnify:CR=1 FL=1|uniref:Uncharacterized protein n=8 Tax=Limestonevirus limestone TaxID=1091052 RepID=I0J338_9CAUD|nr:hypothetical protein G379_gp064 [Dickeya phage vB-DsoM-LIMEstone1]ASD51349.1 hypothetical protein [Dickeya phage JA15]ASD51544.1 hypothetical protein [Dickeya phage XF4]ATW62166.1 hypothetical protein [Dickeya phage PP35]AYN55542.1 hypothetical protein [Dickeya phage Coodle]AYN55745.1 hypothetical protein [Dickeya phage Kamild]QHB42076.1 hypothetical protein [Dickeya phage Ds16CZ]QHB42279.1 hypothetical protein [Dickeya phage Ds20CZ]
MNNTLLIKNVKSLLLTERLPNFSGSSQSLFDHGFLVKEYEYDDEQVRFEWAAFYHPILNISVKLIPNKFFGCRFSDIEDPDKLLSEQPHAH